MDKNSNDPSVCPYCHQKIKSFQEAGGHHCTEDKMTNEEKTLLGTARLVTGDESKKDLSAEDDEMLHDLVDEVIQNEGRWDTKQRRILYLETNDPLFAHHVREYHEQCPCGQPNCREHSKYNVDDKENNPVKEAFIQKRTDEDINEMIERIVMEAEYKT